MQHDGLGKRVSNTKLWNHACCAASHDICEEWRRLITSFIEQNQAKMGFTLVSVH